MVTTARSLNWLATVIARSAEHVDQTIGWFRLPRVLGLGVLVGLRHQLRAQNLYDAGPVPDPGDDGPSDYLVARTRSGRHNDLGTPQMGALGCRFGRNVPPAHQYPEPAAQLLEPNPRLISRKLLARTTFQPATTLNVLAAAWIQFEVHDWFSH
ncbi:MAG TPA: peroxidase family protein, partial [Gemmatimonadales bacterium]|nr:peroxidase family protein [Gemmatimonadales bacterium]